VSPRDRGSQVTSVFETVGGGGGEDVRKRNQKITPVTQEGTLNMGIKKKAAQTRKANGGSKKRI